MTATPGISARAASLVLAALGATLSVPIQARAADEAILAPLRGLAGASEAVEDGGAEATRHGLTKKQVLADIEAQLRDGGVRDEDGTRESRSNAARNKGPGMAPGLQLQARDLMPAATLSSV